MAELLKVSTGLTGKMEGMTVITTAMSKNENCKRLSQIKGSICEHCYSKRSLSYRQKMRECYEKNGKILSEAIIPENQIPYINGGICRFESHGDLINETHLENYVHIAERNPHCTFALWSKQYPILLRYFKTHKQPENMIIVISSLMLNKEIDIKPFENIGMRVKSFTVYDKIVGKSQIINCGSNKCIDCRRCYEVNNDKFIKEIIK